MRIRFALLLTALLLALAAFTDNSQAQSRRKAGLERQSDSPHRVCLRSGFKAGTARYAACRRDHLARSKAPAAPRRAGAARPVSEGDQRAQCLKNGTGIITPLGGSSYSVKCPGLAGIVICPGHAACQSAAR